MQTFPVTEQDLGRLDQVLLQRYPLLRPGLLHRYLRENKIKVNAKKVPLSTRLTVGDTITLYIPDHALTAGLGPNFLYARACFDVVYEDEHLLIVNKPAGLIVADETGKNVDTLINRALLYLYQKNSYTPQQSFSPCLCHRLDTGTSGLVLIAKTQQAEQAVTQLIKTRRMVKKYLCVTFGRPSPACATLSGYLQKDAAQGYVRICQKSTPGAKKIITQYKMIAQSGPLALLEIELVTGRTHQIRAHLASIGCPILGDSKYGNLAANRAYKMKYQALCAYCISFPALEGVLSPLSHQSFFCPKPWYYTQVLEGRLM